jgi:glycosyltransferase involved in cell wall biosynthesis
MKPIKILVVGDYPPPYGGIAVHVQQLHQFLRREGIESSVLDIGKGGRPDPDVLPVRSRARYAAQLLRFASRGWLTHLHVTGDNSTAWAVIASVVAAGGAFGLPPVVTLHSGLFHAYLDASGARRFRARALLAGCGRVVAVSEQIRSALLRAGVPPAKVAVHPAFCGSQLRASEPPVGFDALGTRYRPLLAMANHPAPLYGRAVMLQALRLVAEKHPQVGLALFGQGVPGEELAAEARAHGVEDRVHDFGELSHPAVLALMKRCDAFVRPTSADGDSISVREALALGVRCVASDAADRPRGVLLFRTGDAVDLAQKIFQAMSMPAAPIERPDVGPALLEIYAQLWARRCGPVRLPGRASPEAKGREVRPGRSERLIAQPREER